MNMHDAVMFNGVHVVDGEKFCDHWTSYPKIETGAIIFLSVFLPFVLCLRARATPSRQHPE
jgi:hypothetical protein